MMRHLRLAAVAVLLLTLSGCQALFGSGPLDFGGGDSSELCSSVKKGEQLVIGDVITAPKSESVTITDVAFTGAKGVVLVRSLLLDIIGRHSIGSSLYPPLDWPAWGERVKAEGATLSPGEQKNLVVVIERGSQEAGHADAIEVTYSSVGGQFRKAGSTKYVFMDSCPD
jgi:hypothetical protein